MKFAQDIIIKPLITEKSMDMIADKKYTFKVATDANKTQVKLAIEEIFGVKVDYVNTANVDGKMRRMGAHQGLTPSYKKAIVQLAEGDSIEIFEGL